MSKLEELIQKYCPDGVVWKRVSEIADTFIGLATSVTKHKVSEGVLLLHNSDIKDGRIEIKRVEYLNPLFVQKNKSKILHTEDVITVHTGDVGTSAVISAEYDGSIGFTTISSRIKDKSIISPRFLCVFLNSGICKEAIAAKTISERNNLNLSSFDELLIPLPPLSVQEEIIRLLDSFSELQAKLQIELQAEFQHRLQQYNYYKESLLSFENRTDVEYLPLKKVLKIKNGRDYKHLGEGSVPVYGSGGIMTYVDVAAYDKPSVLIPRKGSIDKLYYVERPFWNVDTVFYTEIDRSFLVEKYLYYQLQNKHLEKLNKAGGVPSLTQGALNEVMIPVPSLPEQQKIVDILDRFDVLTNDLTDTLPAEIEKRRQQYEYYRDKLLTFKRL